MFFKKPRERQREANLIFNFLKSFENFWGA